MADEFIYQESLSSESTQHPFIDKEVLYVTDSNNGSYSGGQIQIDTSTLSNSGKWLDFSEAVLEVPFVMTMKSDTDLTSASPSGFMMGLKNGNHQIIDSLQVDYNNHNVIQLQQLTNAYVSYKMITSWSESDIDKWGSEVGFHPDTAGSSSYSAGASADGNGTSANVPLDPVAQYVYTGTQPLAQSNQGYLKRLQTTSHPAGGYAGNPALATASALNSIGKSYFSDDGGSGSARIYKWSILATIRLKDIADFFDKIPLVRGAFLRLTINFNACSQTITTVAAGPTMVQAAPVMLAGRTNPMLMASSEVGAPMNLPVAGGLGAVLSVACGVVSVASPAGTNSILNAVRLYCPAYTMDPLSETEYLSQRVKEVEYEDVYQYTVAEVASGASFNQILTNGISHAQQLVILPVFSDTAGEAATIALKPNQSIFDTVPATSSPLTAINQFNCAISGANVFQQNVQYDFDMFQNEVARDNALSGGAMVGLTSGLLSRYDWDNLYRYMTVDISRRLPAEDSIPKSITITGTNVGAKALTLYTWISFKRSVSIDLSTGSILV